MYYSSGNYEAFATPKKPDGVDGKSAYLVGSGLAALSAACYLVRDAQMKGEHVHILEKDPIPGGACDGYKYQDIGYVMRGGREMDNHFECMWDLFRSIPFIILLTWVMPVSRAIMGTAIYVQGAIVPLVFGAVPFFARQVQGALAELDPGLIEAALAMGSSPWEIIFRVYLKESVASIARGTTITAISLLNLTAMAGVVGAGGLGDFAIRYGHDRNMMDVTNVTVLILVLFVCIIEFAGGRVVKKNTH